MSILTFQIQGNQENDHSKLESGRRFLVFSDRWERELYHNYIA